MACNTYKKRLFKQLILLLLCAMPNFATAQNIELPFSFEQLLNRTQLQFNDDSLDMYKLISHIENDYLTYDFEMYSKKEKLDIRCYIKPYDAQKVSSQYPNIEVGRILATLSANEADHYMTSRGIEEIELESVYHADWGMVHFFRPKVGFSSKRHCKMITLYKEGVGTIFVFYLFDKVDNAFLENRAALFSF